MIKKSLTKKVNGGKLFRVDIGFEDEIKEIKITGDFFMHPEDLITEIEKSLIGLNINSSQENILEILEDDFNNILYNLIGLSFEDLSDAIVEVLSENE